MVAARVDFDFPEITTPDWLRGGYESVESDPRWMESTRFELRAFLQNAKSQEIRTMRQFAEEEIWLPNGPRTDRRFSCATQPYTGLLFDEIDSGKWDKIVGTGPTQSGKTLSLSVITTLYHLFELGESVVFAVPLIEMAGDKWREDILPVIERTRYRNLVPKSGAGSRGGAVKSIKFNNGATLRFMGGLGGDKARAGFTARVLVITEVDGMDQASSTSRESDPITQLEGRLLAFCGKHSAQPRIYMECTVSIEEGKTWTEYTESSASKIYPWCPHCGKHVFPEREHLRGWELADTKDEAGLVARLHCPSCDKVWSEDDRMLANQRAKIVHKGEEIDEDDGTITGEKLPGRTLGFRWSWPNNMFVSAEKIGEKEWSNAHSRKPEDTEKELRQFFWTLPVEPVEEPLYNLKFEDLIKRVDSRSRGLVPENASNLTIGVDIHKRIGYWTAIAWMHETGTGHVVDYGTFDIEGVKMEKKDKEKGVHNAIVAALKKFYSRTEKGWQISGSRDSMVPACVWIDSNYQPKAVCEFIRWARRRTKNNRYLPTIGRGVTEYRQQKYTHPQNLGKSVSYIGDDYHFRLDSDQKVYRVWINADEWKEFVQRRLVDPIGENGAITLFDNEGNKLLHEKFVKQLLAEKPTEEFVMMRGIIKKWKIESKENHWLDSTYIACAGGHCLGFRLDRTKPVTAKPAQQGKVYHVKTVSV